MRDLFRSWLPWACVFALSGCVLAFDGAPCSTDLQCPSNQVCKVTDGVGTCVMGSAPSGGGGGSTTTGGGGGSETGGGGGSTSTGGGGGAATGGGGGAPMGGGGGSIDTGGGGGASMGGGGGSATGGGGGSIDTGGGGGASTGGGGGAATGGGGGDPRDAGGSTGGGGGTSSDGGTCVDPCTLSGPCACAIFDVRPAFATAGSMLTLEGRFHSSAVNTVIFPNGVTATASVTTGSSWGRANVTVPPDAGVGPLSLALGAPPGAAPVFRRVTFASGLGRFDAEYDQTAYGIPMPSLPEGADGLTATVIGRWLYVMGATFVQRARINADDTLGPFKAMPSFPSLRRGHTVHVVGNKVYLIGGLDSSGAPNAMVLVGTLTTGGELIGVTPLGNALNTARSGHGSIILGDWLYVIGGQDATGAPLGTVERARLSGDGSLGKFDPVPGVSLLTPRSHFGLAAAGAQLLVVGGRGATGTLASVEYAFITTGLGAFGTTSSLGTAREGPLVMVNGTRLWVVGGLSPSANGPLPVATAESASLITQGVSPFGPDASTGFQLRRARAASVVVGNFLYAVGGVDGVPLTSLERASLLSNGTFAAPAVPISVGNTLNGQPVVFGQQVYLVGADADGGILEAPVDAEGRLGAFTRVAGTDTHVSLTPSQRYPRAGAALAVVEDQLWVLGGSFTSGGTDSTTASVVRFSWSGGTLAQLSASPALAVSRAGATALCRGASIVVLGGATASTSGTVWTFEGQLEMLDTRAVPLPDFFSITSSVLLSPRAELGRYVGRKTYVFGGTPGGSSDEVSTWFTSTGSGDFLNTFSTATTMSGPRASGATVALGPWVYLLGGNSAGVLLSDVSRAGFSPTQPGELIAFGAAPGFTVTSAPGLHRALVLGNYLYHFAGNQVVRYELR